MFLQPLWEENIAKVKENMERNKVDLVFLCDPPNFHYLIGQGPYQTRTMYESSFGEYVVLLRSEDLPHVFCNSYYHEFYLDRLKWVSGVHAKVDLENFLRKQRSSVNSVEMSREGPVELFERVKQSLESQNISAIPRCVEEARVRKSSLEVEQIRAAARIATRMMRSAVDATKPNAREFEIAASAEFTMRKNFADTFSFSTIASSGVNAGVMQEVLSDRKIRKNELVMIDLGATKNCYNEEFTRTVEVGAEKSLGNLVSTVREALDACLDEIYPGNKCSAPDVAARKVIEKANLPDFNHPTGHGVGTAVWEYPSISAESQDVIEEGMVLAVEPGTYIKGRAGVRLEENLLVTKNGYEILTKFPLRNKV